jgi:hypothetical protein
MPFEVGAAEYAGGHVFMATADGKLYAAEQGDWETCYLVGESKNYAKIKDMAYDTTTGTMYALIGTANNIYSIDLSDGYMTKEYSVSRYSLLTLFHLILNVVTKSSIYPIHNTCNNPSSNPLSTIC